MIHQLIFIDYVDLELKGILQASKDGPAAPILCGKNSGYHMILEAQDACNSLTFTWTTSTTRTWNIHTQQILCTDPHKPPEGCLQYFTGFIRIEIV